MEQNYNKSLFCANCQADVMHTGTVDANGDIVFTCSTPECGRFLKLPAPQQLDGVTYDDLIADHKTANEGQVSLMGSIDALAALTDSQATIPAEQEVAQPEATVEPSVMPVEEVVPSTDATQATVTSEDTTVTSEAPADQVAPTEPDTTVQEAEIVTDPTI